MIKQFIVGACAAVALSIALPATALAVPAELQNGPSSFITFGGDCSGAGAAKGIDVSEHQGIINWSQVKDDGIDFAIIRLGYGDDLNSQDDRYFAANVAGCKANRIPFGVYLFSYAKNVKGTANDPESAESEAQHALRVLRAANVSPSDLALPVYYDMEDLGKLGPKLEDYAKEFCTTLESNGYKTGIYSNQSWWMTRLTAPYFQNATYKWVAQYRAAGLSFQFNNETHIWQFSSAGVVNGIDGRNGSTRNVDLNYTYIPGIPTSRVKAHEAATVADGIYTITTALADNKVLDVAGASKANGANVQLYDSNDTNAQKFRIKFGSDGFYTIENINSGKVLDVAGGSYRDSANVQQYEANNSDAQKWRIDFMGTGAGNAMLHKITNKGSGRVLDVAAASTGNGANIQQYTSNDTTAQRFYFKPTQEAPTTPAEPEKPAVPARTLSDGTYVIASALAADKVLDVAGASTKNGANVQLYALNNSKAQQFKLTYGTDGYYTIENVNSGMVLDVKGASKNNGANVQQYTGNSSDAQKWCIEQVGTNTSGKPLYKLTSKASDKVLDVAAASTKNGANIQQYASNNTDAQKFTFNLPVDSANPSNNNASDSVVSAGRSIADGTYFIKSALDENKALDIAGGSVNDGANVQLYDANDTAAQKFKIRYGGDGFYTIENARSGRVLDVAGGSKLDGGNVHQYSSNETDAQKWNIEYAGNNTAGTMNYYILTCKASGKVLDVAGGSTRNGANIQQFGRNNSFAQKFILVATL